MPEIFGLGAIGGIALHKDALDAPLVDEIVDVAAAPRGRERRIHIGIVDAIGRQPLRIDVDLERRDVGQVGQAYRREFRIVVCHREQAVARFGEFGAAHPAAILELHREARRIAKAAHRAGDEREDLRVAQAAQRLARAIDNRIGGIFLARPVVPMSEVDIALAGVLARRRAAAAARDQEQRLGVRLLLRQQIFFDFVAHFERACLRGAGGQTELDRNASLILVGQEAAGQTQEEENERGEQQEIDAEEEPFAVDDLGHAADIAGDRVVEARVETVFRAFEESMDAREAPAARRCVMALRLEQG